MIKFKKKKIVKRNHLAGRSLKKIGSFGVLPCNGVGLKNMLNFFDISISDIYWYFPPWIEMLVTPLVVVQIVGIDLLRELGFVIVLRPVHIYHSSTFWGFANEMLVKLL